ncbi:amt-2-like protein isoform X1 [Nomia melanderi]|uniref:amt-2-like protein isoform X1 n=1 Tax=Nomia melanderi TaxID=2448451 RepID=UPI003FCEE303
MVNSHPDEFEYTYYDDDRAEHHNGSLTFHVPSATSVRVVLVILLRVGFVLIHVGSVPVNNVNLILLQNVVDVCWATMAYAMVGYLIAYNGDGNGLIGEGYWIGDAAVDKDEALIGWSLVVIAAAICTSGVVGRMHTVGYLLMGFLLAGLVQPFLIHWIWTPGGWIKKNLLNGSAVRFRDYAGATVVHLVGGLSGLMGCVALGRRILRLSAIDDASIATGTSGTVFAGELMVFVGLQSLSMSNEKLRFGSKTDGHIYLNNLLAASSCSVLVVAFHFVFTGEEFNHWTVMRCVQATVAGLAMVSAGTDFYSPEIALALGAIGSIVFFLVSKMVFQSALEDYCNVAATHVACAFLGSFLAPLFDIDRNAEVTANLMQFFWQTICLLTVASTVAIVMYAFFISLESLGLLRNRSEHLNHSRANRAMETLEVPRRNFFRRLFRADEDPVYIQPGSTSDSARRPSVGIHAMKYQGEDAAVEKGRVVETKQPA